MLALKIIGGIVLFFCLLLLIPVGGRAIYSEDGFFLWLKIACFTVRIFPPREKKQPDAAREQKKAQKQQKKAEKRAEKKHAESQQNVKDGAAPKEQKPGELKRLLPLIRPALNAMSKLRRQLTIRQIRVLYRIGGAEDPAGAAIKYGVVSAGGGALLPLVNGAFRVKDWDIDLDVDFESNQTRVAFAAEGSWRLGQLAATALSLGIKALSIYTSQSKPQRQNHKEELKHGRKASDR